MRNSEMQSGSRSLLVAPSSLPPAMRISLSSLLHFIRDHNIEYVYSLLEYDYAAEVAHARGEGDQDSRARFLDRMSWVGEPSPVDIRRMFNQINTAFAEKWALDNSASQVLALLIELNRLILFRQGKELGLRRAEIEYGVRTDLDFFDPRRQFKRLRGITPSRISDALGLWADAVVGGPGGPDLVLALAFLFIAVHPFPDGNGRLARVMYRWLRVRWKLPAQWLAEDQAGEFLRTGMGLGSTEHLMASVILQACGGHNRVTYGPRGEDADEKAFDALKSSLQRIRSSESLVGSEPFVRLNLHLQSEGHFKVTSPRFESLRSLLR